jgi:hypothetical protein
LIHCTQRLQIFARDVGLINFAVEFLITNATKLFPQAAAVAPVRPSTLPPDLRITMVEMRQWKPQSTTLDASIPSYPAPAPPAAAAAPTTAATPTTAAPPSLSLSTRSDLASTLRVCPKSRPLPRVPSLVHFTSTLLKEEDDMEDQVIASMFYAHDLSERGKLEAPEFLDLLEELLYTHQLHSSTTTNMQGVMNEVDKVCQ